MATIQLVGGREAAVDDEDLPYLGELEWRVIKACSYKGKEWVYPGCYVYVGRKQKLILLHRMVIGCIWGDGKIVDHINGDTLDARKINLRICSHSENRANQRQLTRLDKKTSRFHGVHWIGRDKKWGAEIQKYHKKYKLGLFEKEEDAAIAYDLASKCLYGSFAVLNFRKVGA